MEWDRVNGRAVASEAIVEVLATEGERVTEGQPLLRIDSQAKAAERSAVERLKMLKSGYRTEEVEQARAKLGAARAELLHAKEALGRYTVTARRAGLLDSIPFKLGDKPPAGAVVTTVLADRAPWARVYLPEPWLSQVRPGDAVDILVDGIEAPITGTVRHIESNASFTPDYTLSEEDRSRLSFVTEVDLDAEVAAALPLGIPGSFVRVVAICAKEVTQLRRDRLTFAMVVMIPLMQLLMFGYSINTKVRNIPIAACDHSASSFSRQLVADVQASQVVRVQQQVRTPEELHGMVRERERGNMELLIATPVKTVELMLGKLIPYVVIGLIQMGAIQLFTFIFLPSILLSGFMFPYQGMPELAQRIAEVLPMTHFMRVVRGIILRDAGFAGLQGDLLFPTGFFLVTLTLAVLRFRRRLD